MTTIKTYDGMVHNVSPAWHAENIAPYEGIENMPEAQIESMIRGFLEASNTRALTKQEYGLLQAATKIRNVNNAWRFMGGRHYREVGFKCLDQVHGNRSTHPCGCKTQHIFDHNIAQAHANGDHSQPIVHHAHHVYSSCDKHAHLVNDFVAHSAQVYADNSAEATKLDSK